MYKRIIFALILLLCAAYPVVYSAEEPSIKQVYQTAAGGNLPKAREMIESVLRAHPKSGKAHYVYAELLAKSGAYPQAREEFATAERIAPGFSFAKPLAVQALRDELAAHSKPPPVVVPAVAQTNHPIVSQDYPPEDSGNVWELLKIGVLVALMFFLMFFVVYKIVAPLFEPSRSRQRALSGGQGNTPYPYPSGNRFSEPRQDSTSQGVLGGIATVVCTVAAVVVAVAELVLRNSSNRRWGNALYSNRNRNSFFGDNSNSNDFGSSYSSSLSSSDDSSNSDMGGIGLWYQR